MKLRINAVSDVGLVRLRNEDMVLVFPELVRDSQLNKVVTIDDENKIFIAAVADGMGGHSAGDYASKYLLGNMLSEISELPADLTEEQLKDYFISMIESIHRQIVKESKMDSSKSGMGSTLISLLFYSSKIYLINVGDSRFYRFRDGILKKMSKDHSLAESLGQDRSSSHVLLNSVGGGENVFVEINDVTDYLIDNDIVFLCSDGLSDMISDEKIESVLSENSSINSLVNAAKDAGGKDNISIVLIKIEE